jgi:hypothetical protein
MPANISVVAQLANEKESHHLVAKVEDNVMHNTEQIPVAQHVTRQHKQSRKKLQTHA